MAAWVVVASVIAIRMATLLRYDIWFDELYSVYAASGDLPGIWSAALADRVHPPGYYLLLWGWLQLVPPTPLGLRILPLLVWLATLWATWWTAGQAGLRPTPRTVTVALVAANPLLFELGAFVRNYGLAVLTTVLVIGTALRIQQRETDTDSGDLVLLGVTAAIAAWSHLFAWPVLAAVMLALWGRRLRKAALVAALAPAVAILPWVTALVSSSALQRNFTENVGWQDPPTLLGTVLMPGRLLVEQPWQASWLLAIPAWVLLVTALRIRPWRALSLAVLLPIALAVTASALFGVGVFEVRYLSVAAVPLTLLVVLALETYPPAPRTWIPAMLLALSALGIARHATWRTSWREVTTRVSSDTHAYAFEGFTLLPLRYYAAIDGHPLEVREIKVWPRPDAAPGWVVLRPATLPDSIAVVDQLRAAGFTVTDSFAVGEGRNAVAGWRFR